MFQPQRSSRLDQLARGRIRGEEIRAWMLVSLPTEVPLSSSPTKPAWSRGQGQEGCQGKDR